MGVLAIGYMCCSISRAIQGLSRSYYAKIIPKEKASEYFGLFDIFGKGATFMGAFAMGITTQIFGHSKAGVALISIMFIIGFILFQKTIKLQENSPLS